jgi:tetratricopeptide (TPR) repeat protein
MEKEKYKKIVDLIINSRLPIIKQLIVDYENPNSRATAGKCLIMLENYEDALEVLLTINQDDFEELYSWLLVLQSIGICYMRGFQNYEKALEYYKLALNLAEKTDERNLIFVRGEQWAMILEVLELLGRKDEVKKEIDEKLKYFNQPENKYRYNSYIFHLNYYLAINETDINKRIEYMYTALNNFELRGEDEEIQLLELWNNKDKDPHKVFDQMENLIRCNVYWNI